MLGHIDGLAKEEERLYAQRELTGDDRSRLARIKVELDQRWDLTVVTEAIWLKFFLSSNQTKSQQTLVLPKRSYYYGFPILDKGLE